MILPIKLAVLTRLTQVLEATPFTEDNSPDEVAFDLHGRVHRGRAIFGHETSGYYLNLIDAPRQDPGITAGQGAARKNSWEVYLQIVNPDMADGRNPYDDLYWIDAAVQQQLAHLVKEDARSGKPMYPDTYRLGPILSKHVTGLEIGPTLLRPPEPNANAHAYSFQSIVFEMARQVGANLVDVEVQ